MHLTIINASPYGNEFSNTRTIVKGFKKGIVESNEKVVVYSLYDRSQWNSAVKSIINNQNVVFVVPVYTGIIPSLFKEFLEQIDFLLTDDIRKNLRISFILQSAFPESRQRKYCEKYLESVVKCLRCNFSGILSHCVYYGLIENEKFKTLLDAYSYFAKQYIENKFTFFFQEAVDFNGTEYLTEKQAKKFVSGFNFMCRHIAEEKGCASDLQARPYESSNRIVKTD